MKMTKMTKMRMSQSQLFQSGRIGGIGAIGATRTATARRAVATGNGLGYNNNSLGRRGDEHQPVWGQQVRRPALFPIAVSKEKSDSV